MSLIDKLKFFLSMQIIQSSKEIFINQLKYLKKLLKKYKLENAKQIAAPMSTITNLDSDLEGKMVDQKTYWGMIRSLLYLTTTRPDIKFSVYLCARFQACPKESHFTAVKRFFRYLVGNQDIRLWYPTKYNLDLVAYTDSDFAGSKLDQKSTSGYFQFC